MLTASNHIITLIKEFEGFSAAPYWDHKQWSWGYGTKAPGSSGTISKSQATEELKRFLKTFEESIHAHITNKGIRLSQNQFDAILSLIYNTGPGAIFTKVYNNGFTQGSTLYNKILQGDFEGAALRFGDFVKASGKVLESLVKRRAKEAALFLKNTSSSTKITFITLSILTLFIGYRIAKSHKLIHA